MNFFKILLFPFAIIYDLITRFRNHLFDIGYKKSVRFDIPVINVGNIIAGGAGKTPMVEYLIQQLSDNHTTATLSRGYGRKTRGFIMASENDTAKTIGDEPFQIFRKYRDRVYVSVCEERALAIPEILFRKPEVGVIVLDDAFQHRYVSPHLNILLTEYNMPFYNDFVLPMGMLREARKGANRADAIIVTKCPDEISQEERKSVLNKIEKYAPGKKVFFTTIKYGNIQPFDNVATKVPEKFVQVSGIANPKPFTDFIGKNYNLAESVSYQDHYKYREKDILKIIQTASKYDGEAGVITTEKDFVRMLPHLDLIERSGISFYYLPIGIQFLFDKNIFDKLVTDAIIAVQRENQDVKDL